jgi:tetratricopeptide (TPR) repeat protein
LLVAAVFVIFSQTVRHDFINYDDEQYVVNNSHVASGFKGNEVAWAFTSFHAGNWHPITWLSHMLDCQFYGARRPGGQHLTNVVLHAANAVLLFLVLERTTHAFWPSAFAATLFAVHPLHVESVAWIAERKDVLSGMFFMLALAAYVWYAQRKFSAWSYMLVLALFATGLMTKPMLVTLPCVLLLLDYWPLGRFASNPIVNGDMPTQANRPARWKPILIEKIPLFGLAAASCVVTVLAQRHALASLEHISLNGRIANAAVAYATYLRQFFYPANLALLYMHSTLGHGLALGAVIASQILLVAITSSAFVLRKRLPFFLVGWLWYLVMLVPVIGVVQVGEQAMADRYTYLPQIGLYLIIAWGTMYAGGAISSRSFYRRTALPLGGFAIVAVLIVLSWRQTSYWQDSQTIWTRTLACNPGNYTAQNNLGSALAAKNEPETAIAHYQMALAINPTYAAALDGLAQAESKRGKYTAAAALYEKALAINANDAGACNNLAWIRAANADPAVRDEIQAVALAERAVALDPEEPSYLDTLAAAYAEAGQFAKAAHIAEIAIGLAQHQGKTALAKDIERELHLYKAGSRFHERCEK